MIEARATISSIEQTRQKLEDLGAGFAGNYAFKDIIFTNNDGKSDLKRDFLRLRVITTNNRPTKSVILVRKKTQFNQNSKSSKVVLKKEFDLESEGLDFITKEFHSDFDKDFEYDRDGSEYDLANARIFVEDIAGFCPSIEIEAEAEGQIYDLFDRIGIEQIIHESVPELMSKILT